METTPAGTSLEVLAPYFPYGLTVQNIHNSKCGLVTCLDTECANVRISERNYAAWRFASILPLLRPFSQLTEPLPDGTVPAVEVAKILLAHQHDVLDHRYEAASVRARESKRALRWIEVTVPGRNDNLDVSIYSDYSLENEDRGVDTADVLAVADYLRSKHFAINLQAHQYLPAPTQGPQTPQTPPPFSRS